MANQIIVECAPKSLSALVSASGPATTPEEALKSLHHYAVSPKAQGGLELPREEARAALARFLILSTDFLKDDDRVARLIAENFVDVSDPARPVYSLFLLIAISVCPAALRPDYSFAYDPEDVFVALADMRATAEERAAEETPALVR